MAASFCNAVMAACENAIKTLKANRNIKEEEQVPVAELLKQNQLKTFEAEGSAEPSEEFKNHSVFSFGANFCEVWVDKDTAMYRIKRMVNVGAAGKILNPKTAYGQIIGGLTMGAGMALADVVVQGAHRRLRPVLMTASITAFGLIPLLFASG